MITGTVLTLVSILVSALLIYTQIKQSNALTWKAALESQSNDLARMEVSNPAIACVFHHNDRAIDDECTVMLRKPANRRQALMYVSQVLDFFAQIIAFSQECDKEYAKGYDQWIDEITHLDITCFYLFINEMDAKQALKEFGIKLNDTDIKKGYLSFKEQMRIRDRTSQTSPGLPRADLSRSR